LGELLDILKNAAKQKELVLAYFHLNAIHKKPITVSQLIETSGATQAIVKALIDKEILKNTIYSTTA
jgi:primosomal protein N' (replication factor Y)